MRSLRRVIDFFALQPFFTLWSLRAFWWIYIFVWVFELYDGLYRHIKYMPGAMFYLWFRTFTWVDLAFLPLSACVAIMVVRLLLEVTVSLLPIANRSRISNTIRARDGKHLRLSSSLRRWSREHGSSPSGGSF